MVYQQATHNYNYGSEICDCSTVFRFQWQPYPTSYENRIKMVTIPWIHRLKGKSQRPISKNSTILDVPTFFEIRVTATSIPSVLQTVLCNFGDDIHHPICSIRSRFSLGILNKIDMWRWLPGYPGFDQVQSLSHQIHDE